MKKIKKCPFCGKVPELWSEDSIYHNNKDYCILSGLAFGLRDWNIRSNQFDKKNIIIN